MSIAINESDNLLENEEPLSSDEIESNKEDENINDIGFAPKTNFKVRSLSAQS